jgi:hypothetical protein
MTAATARLVTVEISQTQCPGSIAADAATTAPAQNPTMSGQKASYAVRAEVRIARGPMASSARATDAPTMFPVITAVEGTRRNSRWRSAFCRAIAVRAAMTPRAGPRLRKEGPKLLTSQPPTATWLGIRRSTPRSELLRDAPQDPHGRD